MMNHSGKQELDHLDETIIRITLCVSFTNLIDDEQTDLAYYLFLLKRIKIDIAPTREGLQRNTDIIETTNELI